jgi:hypothetical protein
MSQEKDFATALLNRTELTSQEKTIMLSIIGVVLTKRIH